MYGLSCGHVDGAEAVAATTLKCKFGAESLTEEAKASHANFRAGSCRNEFRSFLRSLPDVASSLFRSL